MDLFELSGGFKEEYIEEEVEYSQDEAGETVTDLNDFYKSSDKQLVRDILRDLGFEYLCDTFEKELVDLEAFQALDSTLILGILNGLPKGIVAKFAHAHAKWKEANNLQSATSDSEKKSLGSISSLLQSSAQGKMFMRNVNYEERLSDSDRGKLMNIIVSSVLAIRSAVSKDEIKRLAVDIIKVFPAEDISSYINVATGLGSFYYKFTNQQKALKTKSKSTIGNKRHHLAPTGTEAIEYDDQEIYSNEFVKTTSHNVDYNTLAHHWGISSRLRLKQFKETDQKAGLISMYSALTRKEGYTLISIDFATLFPNSPSFFLEWNTLKLPLYQQLQHDNSKRADFAELSENKQVLALVAELTDNLYGPAIIKHNGKKYRASKNDALKFIIFRCNTVNSMENDLIEWTNHLSEYGISKQAVIVCFGPSFNEIEDRAVICVDDVKYSFEGETCLVSALDTLLKLYHVLDLQYPKANQNVYEFLSKKFLHIDGDDVKKAKKGNKVQNLVSSLM